MASMSASGVRTERWEIGDQIWSRDPATGAFDLVDYKGLGSAPASQDPLDWVGLVGARLSRETAELADDDASGLALFPGDFRFSPRTGKPLSEPSTTGLECWQPPFGASTIEVDRPQGLRLTSLPLTLSSAAIDDDRAGNAERPVEHELPIPRAGRYQFLVSAFSTCESRLLALEASRGLLYCWLPHSARWVELRHVGEESLAASTLADNAWAMAAQDHRGSNRMFLPTDDGLAVVSVNLVAGSYEVHTVGHCCVGAPMLWQGRVHVPMLDREGKLGVYTLHPEGLGLRRLDGPELDPAAVRWVRPLADAQRIVWMGSRGQLIVERDDEGSIEATLLPWRAGVTPRFDRGAPSLFAGQLWQPCFLRDEQGGRFVLLRLGMADAEIRPEEAAGDDESDRLRTHDHTSFATVYPLLASTTSATRLCARVENAKGVDSSASTHDILTTTFELQGTDTLQFWSARLARPWATQPFVYAGRLYLYHPDMQRLPGWRIGG